MKYLNIFKKAIVLPVVILVGASGSNAQTEPVNITTSAVPFLGITPDARAAGMGNIGIATSADANAVFHNSAKLVFNQDKSGIAANYVPWLRNVTSDMYLASLSGYYKLDDQQAFSASLRYFSMGDVSITNYSGQPLQTSRPREFAADLGYARKLSDRLSLAANIRYIYSDLVNGSVNGISYSAGNAVAGDVSAYYNGLSQKGEGWTAGLALSNLGSKISYTNNADQSFLPANLGLGGAYTKAFDEDNHLTIGAEVNKLLVPAAPSNEAGMEEYYNTGIVSSWGKSFGNDAYQVNGGLEYDYRKMLFVRAGYSYEGENQGNRKYVTGGVGLHYNTFQFDFAYLYPTGTGSNLNPLTNTMRFGVAFQIGSQTK